MNSIILLFKHSSKKELKKTINQLEFTDFNSNKFYNGLVFYNISCSLDYNASLGIPQTWNSYLRKQKHLPRAGE